jgi:hypothetical protein
MLHDEEFTAMKTLLLACTLAMSAGAGTAFASVTIYTDGSTFDSAAANPAPKNTTLQVGAAAVAGWHGKAGSAKVVRFGPLDAGGLSG